MGRKFRVTRFFDDYDVVEVEAENNVEAARKAVSLPTSVTGEMTEDAFDVEEITDEQEPLPQALDVAQAIPHKEDEQSS